MRNKLSSQTRLLRALALCFVVLPSLAVAIGASSSLPALASVTASSGSSLDTLMAQTASDALAALNSDLANPVEHTVLSEKYVDLRRELSVQVGYRLGKPPELLEYAWLTTDIQHQIALMAALSQIGVPYKRYMMGPSIGFDCSGLTSFAWLQAGFPLARNSTQQIRRAAARTLKNAQAGDLVRYPGHVMMWLGVGNAVVHSPRPRKFVEVVVLSDWSMKRSRLGDPSISGAVGI